MGFERCRWPGFVALAVGLASCGDPVQEATIRSLGPEDPLVSVGPLHRPGQPCLVCHDGVHAQRFSIAGTVIRAFGEDVPSAGTEVWLMDASGATFVAVTNCAGNFMVRPEEIEPDFPLWTRLRRGDLTIEMDSPIGGQGACAHCHAPTEGPDSPGPVYLHPFPPTEAPGPCP